ncbi:MAG: hypothetical protein OHK006_09160 [Thermodesulfovibrionales bacterium]
MLGQHLGIDGTWDRDVYRCSCLARRHRHGLCHDRQGLHIRRPRGVLYVTGTAKKKTEYGTTALPKSGTGWRMHSEKCSDKAPEP